MIPTFIDDTEESNYNNYGIPPVLPFSVNDVTIGPILRSDSSQGLTAKFWGAYFNQSGSAVYIRDMSLGTDTFLFNEPESMKKIALAFDQNGNEVIAWITLLDVLKIRYFDTTVDDYVSDSFGVVSSLTLTMDMKYFPSSSESDVLLFYIRNGAIFSRVQRDKYLVERATPVTSGAIELVDSGMRTDYRFQVRWR